MTDNHHPDLPGDDRDATPDAPTDELRDRVQAAERAGLEALEAGDYEAAASSLLEAVTGYEELGDPKSTNSAAYYFGVSLAAQGKTAQALRVWEEVVERGLDSPSAFIRLIRYYEEQNDPSQVRRLFDKLGQAANEKTGEFFASIEGSQAAKHARELTAAIRSGGRPRALIADDEEGILVVVERALASAGYEVVRAVDGNQALNTILTEPLDLIILDVFMPGHTGLDVLYRLRAEGIRTRVIVISGKGDKQMVRDAQRMGAEWLGKPFSVADLENVARNAIDKLDGDSVEGDPT